MKKIGLEKGQGNAFAKIFMRINVVIALIGLFCLQVKATNSFGQITLHEKDVSLAKVLDDIHRQTGVSFGGQEQNVSAGHPVSISVKNAPLQEVLELVFNGQPFSYEIVGNIIVIEKKQVPDILKDGSSEKSPGKIVRVQGTVVNEGNQPLAGANVTILETKRGTTTNALGQFDLGTIPINSTVLISFIGYAPQKIVVKDVTNIRISLKAASNELDKVVIQAYGVTTQRLQTGDISTVTAADIEKQPVMNAMLAVQGRVPGLDVVSVNGYASAPIHVELRGRSSVGNFPTDPLYIVDGVPLTVNEISGNSGYAYSVGFLQNPGFRGPAYGQSPTYSINSDDIESITVLKDADATSIYGSRGANGVILITTKRGKAGKTQFDLKVEEGVAKIDRFWQMLNTHQYASVRREALYNDGIAENVNSAYDLVSWDTSRYTDWQRALFGGAGLLTNVQGSLSGGDAHTTFRIGVGYNRQTGITTVSGADQRGSMSLNLVHKSVDQRFTVSSTTQYTIESINLINMAGSVTMPPDAPPIYDSAGNLNYEGWAPIRNQYPFSGLKQPYVSNTNFLNSNLTLNFEVFKGFNVKSSFGYNYSQVNQTNLITIASQDPLTNPTGTSQFGYNNNKNWIVEPQVSYDNVISKGKISTVIGGSLQDNSTDGQYVYGQGYTSDALLRTVSNAPSQGASDSYGEYKYAAIFGRLNYNWEDQYILNISARRDGSSKFGPDHEFGNFGAIGAAWIFTEQGWFKRNMPVLSFGKIKGSYGSTGSDQVTPYSYLTRWSSSGLQPYNGIQPLAPTQHANPNYQWQVNKKLEASIDVGFLENDRINVTAVYYRDRCGDQLVQYPLPYFTGFSSVTANLPALVQNVGYEGKVLGKIISTKWITWSVNGNISINKNKLVSYPNLALSPYASYYQVGKPLNLVYLLHYTGVDPQTGQYTFEDKNHDGVISTNPGPTDDRFIHNLSPKFFGGFGTDFTFRQLQLSVFFVYKSQIGQNAVSQGSSPGLPYNQPIEVLGKEWRKPGDIASVARFTTNPTASDNYFLSASDGGYTDASFIRLKNVSLSYGLPTSYIKKVGMKSFNLYVRATNLFVFTKYKGIDPETQNFGSLPPEKYFTFGATFTY